ncbi:TetR/AcrR family transcriptional regulator [Geobacter sp. FeAm09]|uniref:TetR/AcrR family transcriptional regulator n=1 Tax=Geobacter sp. FeAm09 TaxID=2597769 RepID=UPI0011EBAC94|nr:TetR/AcrR family transcriptional regulator [Geobacter sp. FeAm09]QEM68822.1 TetR/AcrR family transcriptional regulator [Geobacter sp. FeAm09]
MAKLDKRSEIVRAAVQIIAEQGFHGSPMAMIAERAGVAAGTIYCYFESKDILIRELYREIEGKMLEALRVGYQTERPIRERFLHLGINLLKYFVAHPIESKYMEQFHNSPYGADLRRGRFAKECQDDDLLYLELFEQGVAQQVMKDLPHIVLFALAFGPMITLTRDHILGFIVLDDALIEKTIAACWDGIKR